MVTISDERLRLGVVPEPLFSFSKSPVVNSATIPGLFLAQVSVEHLVIEDV
jgi:hypothetical protein